MPAQTLRSRIGRLAGLFGIFTMLITANVGTPTMVSAMVSSTVVSDQAIASTVSSPGVAGASMLCNASDMARSMSCSHCVCNLAVSELGFASAAAAPDAMRAKDPAFLSSVSGIMPLLDPAPPKQTSLS